MGNCQASEAATVVIHHPGIKIQRIYRSVSVNEIMTSNPGHYVAHVITASTTSENGTPLKQLKLLRPDDTLHIGHVYRLVSFEEVLKEFAAKKCVKLGRLLEKGGKLTGEKRKQQHQHHRHADSDTSSTTEISSSVTKVEQEEAAGSSSSTTTIKGVVRQQHWRPALESIAEDPGQALLEEVNGRDAKRSGRASLSFNPCQTNQSVKYNCGRGLLYSSLF